MKFVSKVQGEESAMWDTYLETISIYVDHEVSHLDDFTQQAIWLQTEEGWAWEDDTLIICDDDIIRYIFR